MKKIFSLLSVLLIITLTLTGCGLGVPRPEVKTGEFDFSITYEFGGEQTCVFGVYVCEYAGLSWTLDGGYGRDWAGYVKDGKVEEMIELTKTDDGRELYLVIDLYPDYFMGEDVEDLWGAPEPYLMVRVSYEDGGVSFVQDAELIEQDFGAKIIGYEYDAPVENSFSIFNY